MNATIAPPAVTGANAAPATKTPTAKADPPIQLKKPPPFIPSIFSKLNSFILQ